MGMELRHLRSLLRCGQPSQLLLHVLWQTLVDMDIKAEHSRFGIEDIRRQPHLSSCVFVFILACTGLPFLQ